MEHIRDSVLKCLDKADNDDRLIQELNHIIKKKGNES